MFYLEIIFLSAVSVQFIYFLLFCIAFIRKQKPVTLATDVQPVSVVVCAHDELENLQELIPKLLTQSHRSFEVIVVDDRSNDATRDWLLEATTQDARLRMVHVNHTPEHINGKKYALTLGIRAAQHEWIVLTDADCRPQSSDWLHSLSAHFGANTQFVLGHSPYQKSAGWLNRFIRFEAIITALQYIGFALIKMPYMGVGRNMAYRKSLFMDGKGFTNMLSLTGGDDDLFVNRHGNARNTHVALGKNSLVTSLPKTTVADFFEQKIRHLAAGKKYKFLHRFVLGLFMFSWVLTWCLGLPLLLLSTHAQILGAALAIRFMLVGITLYVALKRLGESFELWSLFVLDIIYTIYYLTTGTAALLTKKIRWKN